MGLKRGQSSIEFIILVSGVLLFFIAFLFYLQTSVVEKSKEGRVIALKEIAVSVQEEIALAARASEGYSREFLIPANVDGKDYEIVIVTELVYVKISESGEALSLPVMNVTGNVVKGENLIRKKDGRIYLNIP